MTKFRYLFPALISCLSFICAAQGQSLEPQTVIIDVAHGGEDRGRSGVLDAEESRALLAIAEELKDVAKDRAGLKLIFTRSEDSFVSLTDRQRIISAQPIALLISIHLGASNFHTESGLSVFYCVPTSVVDDLDYISQEDKFFTNAPLDCPGDELANKLLAQKLEAELSKNMKLYYDGVQSAGVKKAPWSILKISQQPAAVVVLSSIDHPIEGRRLLDRRYRRVLATSLYQSIENYLQK